MHLEARLDESDSGTKYVIEYVVDDGDVDRVSGLIGNVILRELADDERERLREELARRVVDEYGQMAKQSVERMVNRYEEFECLMDR